MKTIKIEGNGEKYRIRVGSGWGWKSVRKRSFSSEVKIGDSDLYHGEELTFSLLRDAREWAHKYFGSQTWISY